MMRVSQLRRFSRHNSLSNEHHDDSKSESSVDVPLHSIKRLSVGNHQSKKDGTRSQNHLLASNDDLHRGGYETDFTNSRTDLESIGNESTTALPPIESPGPRRNTEVKMDLGDSDPSQQRDEPEDEPKKENQPDASLTTLISLFLGLGFATLCTGLV